MNFIEPPQTNTPASRPEELTQAYLKMLDNHITDLRKGRCDEVWQIADFAKKLFVHPVHLSNVVKQTTQQSTCHHFETRMLEAAKDLLKNTNMSIGAVAMRLTYDPSNFTKFFKAYTGQTPSQFRKCLKEN